MPTLSNPLWLQMAMMIELLPMKWRHHHQGQMNFRGGLKSKRAIWSEMFPENIQSFSRLTVNDLRALTLGVYHTIEHMSADGSYWISIHKEDSNQNPIAVTCLPRSNFFGFRLMNTQHHLLMVGIESAKFGQGLLGVVRTLQQSCGILAIRYTRQMKFCQRQMPKRLFFFFHNFLY